MAIPITYINSTGQTDFQVLVFTKNFSVNTPETFYAAWQVLRAQTSSSFEYPVDIEVGAIYESAGQTIISGPFAASLGSTWGVIQHSPNETAVLSESKFNAIDSYQVCLKSSFMCNYKPSYRGVADLKGDN